MTPRILTATEISTYHAHSSMTPAQIAECNVYDPADSPEVKKWKDRFRDAALLWLDCEYRIATTPLPTPVSTPPGVG